MKRALRASVPLKYGLAAALACFCSAPALAQSQAASASPAKPSTAKPAAAKPTAAPLSGPGSLNGVWAPMLFKNYRTGPPGDAVRAAEAQRAEAQGKIKPEAPPYRPEVLAKIEAQRKADAGKPRPGNGGQCLTSGMPGVMSPPPEDVIQFVETPDQKQITVLVEFYGTFRIIHVNEKHPDDPDPTMMGNAVGHWENGTLVVDTIALDPKAGRIGGGDAVQHSDQMRIVEHIRRVDKNTLEDRQTIIDPAIYTKPWDRVIRLQKVPGLEVREWVCENQRNGPDANGFTSVKLEGNSGS